MSSALVGPSPGPGLPSGGPFFWQSLAMDRCALFIDAGYLLAEGGSLCCGVKKRDRLECDYEGLVRDLRELAERTTGLQLLRCYWYDAAKDAVPSLDQLEIAGFESVKLRLGRLSGGKQKGVDSLLVRDVMTLARERAVATAVLLAGDEDLREGVVAAQDMGVRVVLVGVEPVREPNQAPTLAREVDELVKLEKAYLAGHLSLLGEHPPEESLNPQARADAAGRAFAEAWTARATDEELLELAGQAPRVPRVLDAELLRSVEGQTGSLRSDQPAKRAVRAGFWDTIKHAARNLHGGGAV